MPTNDGLSEIQIKQQKHALSALLFKLLFQIYGKYDLEIIAENGIIIANCPDRPRTKYKSKNVGFTKLYQIFETHKSTDTTDYMLKIQNGHGMVELPNDIVLTIAGIDCFQNLYNLRSTSGKKDPQIDEAQQWSDILKQHIIKPNLKNYEVWTESQINGLLYLKKIAQEYYP